MYPVGKLRNWSLGKLRKHPSTCPGSNPLKKTWEFFHNLPEICSQNAWTTHWEFFHKLLSNLATIWPPTYSMILLRVCWKTEQIEGFFWVNWKKLGEYVAEYVLNNLWKNSQWVAKAFGEQISGKLWKNSQVFFKGLLPGQIDGCFLNLSSDQFLNLPTGYIKEFFHKMFLTYPLGIWWVNW